LSRCLCVSRFSAPGSGAKIKIQGQGKQAAVRIKDRWIMRQKAERKIREAALAIGAQEYYRIDQVRARTDLIRKVFDKTILHMAFLGTIELKTTGHEGLTGAEIGDLIRQGDVLYVQFRFLDGAAAPEPVPAPPQTTDILLERLDLELWRRFEKICQDRESKTPQQKITELISEFTDRG